MHIRRSEVYARDEPASVAAQSTGPARISLNLLQLLLSNTVQLFLPIRDLDTSSSSSPRSSLHVSSATEATTAATAFFSASRPSFLYSSAQLRTTPPNSAVPEVAIIGASNVGKSTFLNALVAGLSPGKDQLARTSARAGHTRTMNAYGVGPSIADDPVLGGKIKKRLRLGAGEEVPRHSLVLVDTPGYGFRSQKEWGDGIIGFLEKRTMLKGVVVLIAAEKEAVAAVVASVAEETWRDERGEDELEVSRTRGRGNGTMYQQQSPCIIERKASKGKRHVQVTRGDIAKC